MSPTAKRLLADHNERQRRIFTKTRWQRFKAWIGSWL